MQDILGLPKGKTLKRKILFKGVGLNKGEEMYELDTKSKDIMAMVTVQKVIKTANKSIDQQLRGLKDSDQIRKIVAYKLCNYFDRMYSDMNEKD